VDSVEHALARAALSAKRNAMTGRVAFSRVRSALGVNRRQYLNGKTVMLPNPEGAHDRAVDTRWFIGRNGKLIASSTTYGCHATALNGYRIGGDYPGYFKDVVEKRTGGVALWCAGCSGNVRPWFTGNMNGFGAGRAKAEQMGTAHAREVLTGRKSAIPVPLGHLRISRKTVRLPLQRPFSMSRAATMVNQEALKALGRPAWPELWAPISRKRSIPCEVQLLSLSGEHHLVYWGGEICTEIGIGLKDLCPGQIVTPHGYANSMAGYIAAEHMYPQGGYEVAQPTVECRAPAPFVPQVQEVLWRASLALIAGHRRA